MARNKPTPEKKGKSTKSAKPKGVKDGAPRGSVHKTKKVPRGSKRDWSQYSHNLPGRTDLAKNGRQPGRNLIAWTRPRMAEKLLLHIEYEALLHNRPIPWDAVAHRFNPGSSGEAITQRLTRMRKELIAEGHLVPPYPQKPGGPVEDVAVRGFIRANPERVDDAHTTRRVLWTEPVDHLKKPLGNAVYALQGHKDNEGDDYEDDDDEDEEADEKTEGSFSRACGSDFGAVHSPKGKGLARPARPSRSTAKNMSYAEDEDDVFDNGGSVMESDIEDDMDDEDQDGDKKFGVRNGSQSSSRASHNQRNGRSQSRGPSSRGHGFSAGGQPTFGYNHYTATPGGRGLGTNHMSPYGMTPNGVHWIQGPMGLPMMPFGMGLDMMGGFNTTPSRSSAFTTHATSPADFDIEDASPRSAAFFQAHLNEYNSPTPRGHANFGPMVPIPMCPAPSDISMMSGNAMHGDGLMLNSDFTPAVPKGKDEGKGEGEGDSDLHQESSDPDFSSMLFDAKTLAKSLKKTNEPK